MAPVSRSPTGSAIARRLPAAMPSLSHALEVLL